MLDTQAACQERHNRFVRRVIAAGEVWGLKGPSGFCYAPSNHTEDRRDVIPFWSDRAYAKQCAKDAWASFEPTSIPLDTFLARWLPGMHADRVLAGTNWSVHLIGSEIEPLKLKEEIECLRTATSTV